MATEKLKVCIFKGDKVKIELRKPIKFGNQKLRAGVWEVRSEILSSPHIDYFLVVGESAEKDRLASTIKEFESRGYSSSVIKYKGIWFAGIGPFRVPDSLQILSHHSVYFFPEVKRPAIAKVIARNISDGRTVQLAQHFYVSPREPFDLIIYNKVGRGFHFEFEERQSYEGEIEFTIGYDGKLLLINHIELERYLASVISSEMLVSLPMEALKAQAVVARNWLLTAAIKHHIGEPFDVCNDDHCQEYRGIRDENNIARKVIDETRGEALYYKGKLVDTRFAKVCGGVTEEFNNVWGETFYSCSIFDGPGTYNMDLQKEDNFRLWIEQPPPAYCNTQGDTEYFEYGRKYFRWYETIDPYALREIINNKTGIDIGYPVQVNPLRRGRSGRILQLQIKGEKGTLDVTGELKIRAILSPTYLPSSAFYVKYNGQQFILRGAGWGHGVGMCQVGAAKLASIGWNYRQILLHYYPNTEVRQIHVKKEEGCVS